MDDKRSSLERRFYSQYIAKGRKILRGDKKYLKDRIGTLMSFLIAMKRQNAGGFKNNEKNYRTVWAMTAAVNAIISGRHEEDFSDNNIKKYMRLASKAFPFLS